MNNASLKYSPRRPKEKKLHKFISDHLDPFFFELAKNDKYLPSWVEDEFRAYLSCGDPEEGFVRLKCEDCGAETILAFSCKKRGFCCSCCGRRMAETEKKLVEEVFPWQNARQWVLSLPIPVRFNCSRNRKILNELVKIFYETLQCLMRKKLRKQGIKDAKSGGILFIQRAGSSVNLHVHFHVIFLDGGFVQTSDSEAPVFYNLEDGISDEDVSWAVTKIANRSIKALKEAGLLNDEDAASIDDVEAIDLCDAASVKNRIAFGERAGQPVRKFKLWTNPELAEKKKDDLTAVLHGFNLKADGVIQAHQRWKLSRLIRYVARPPIAEERLFVDETGQTIKYVMKNPWTDGTKEIIFSGIEFIEKLASLIPPPNGHLIRFIGVLGPNSKMRPLIVPKRKPKARDTSGKLLTTAAQRVAWAELMKHVFGFDVTTCENCGGRLRRISIIRDRDVAKKILICLSRKENKAGPARSPPGLAPVPA